MQTRKKTIIGMKVVYEKLTVRHFGPVSNLDIIIRPLTLFIGTQGSGKSTIAKLLTICREQRWWWNRPGIGTDFQKRLRDFGIADYMQEDSYIEYTLTDDETRHPNVVTYENGHFQVTTDGNREGDVMRYQYVPAERNLIGNMSEAIASMVVAEIPISKLLLEYMSQFERAAKMFPRYAIPFFGVDYVRLDHRNLIELKGKDRYLPLSASSSGLQSAIPMLMIVDYALKSGDRDAIVIEEPEQNLFPENQREVLNFIASRLSGGENRQFVLTTHSPYMLSCLNVLMLAHKLYGHEDLREQVADIVRPEYMVSPADVAAYSLNPDDEDGIYCKSLISEKTGMVSVNALDTASIYIGDEFDRLYRLYIKVIKGKK